MEGYKYIVCFFMEDGWMERDFNCFGGPGVLVLLAEANQCSIELWGQVFCDELAGGASPGEKLTLHLSL